MVLEGCKWDPQVGDVGTVAPFALVLRAEAWRELAGLAERLAREAEAAEGEILERPELLSRLGLPARLRRVLTSSASWTPAAARVVRFDFHPTADGWRISEANADVPGGYAEAWELSRLMSEYVPGSVPAGDPAGVLADAILARVGKSGPVGLLAATGFMEDQQVVAYLARRLERLGYRTRRLHPRQVRWVGGRAYLDAGAPLGALVRFYQGEWLAGLPRGVDWAQFLRGGVTPVCNPATALVVESKRFPLVWDALTTPLSTWRLLLPETRAPDRAALRGDGDWVLKAAFSNTGDDVLIPGLADRRQWRHSALAAWLQPSGWLVQRRFDALAVATPLGAMYPCLGVYSVDGRAAGVYGRLSPRPWINHEAIDVAVLITASIGDKLP
jgi:glutathionylspermidine synthase